MHSSSSASSQPPPPSLIDGGVQQQPQQGSRLCVVGIRIGNVVSKAIASTIVSSAIATPALVGEAVIDAAAVTSAAQAEALGLLVLRIPLADATRLEQFTVLVEKYLVASPSNVAMLNRIAAMPTREQMLTVGVQGSLIGAVAAAAVQQSILTAKYVAGKIPQNEPSYSYQSLTIALGVVAGVGGGAAGAAVGTLFLPGIGTSLGALAGSFTASFLPSSLRKGNTTAVDGAEEAWNPSRVLRVTEGPLDGWLEVSDETTAVTFAQQWDDATAVPTAARVQQEAVWRDAMSQTVADDEVLVFLSQSK